MANNDLKRIKETGSTRLSRIRDILKLALSETLTEVQHGTGEVREILKESVSTNVEPSQALSDSVVVETTATETNPVETPTSPSLASLFLTWLKDKQYSSLSERFQDLKVRMDTLDRQLTERYGDRYQLVKDQANNANIWYKETRAKVDAGEEAPGDTFQRRLDDKAQTVGTAIAQREAAIKERLQTMWQAR